MAEPKPPPRTLEMDEERKVQLFLERAAAVVLESPVLDLRRWQTLVALAEELGLHDEQLRATVNDLRQRGVIAEIDLAPLKPPPLPPPSRSARDTPETISASDVIPESDFSLTPPPTGPRKPTAAAARAAPPPPPFAPPSASHVSEPTSPSAAGSATSLKERIDLYHRRAAAILAEQRGMTPRAHAMLAAALDELGLTAEQVSSTSAAKRHGPAVPPPPPNKSDLDNDAKGRRRWRVEGEPPPEPPPPSRKPEEVYREYLRATLSRVSDGLLPAVLETKLLRHATSVLGLAHVFARHLLEEEAAGKNFKRESGQAAAATPEPEPTAQDPRAIVFLERAVAVLAEHRGINAKSRVFLNAIAQEVGLSEEETERALAAMQRPAAARCSDAESRQQERLVGFRALVSGTLVSLPRKILTANVEQTLLRHGEDLHGLTPDLARAAIRDVCSELSVVQITEQQAREHIEQLVDAKLGDSSWLSEETKDRIRGEGEQWGLTVSQVNALVKERMQSHARRRRAESNFSNGVLIAAGIAVVLVFALLAWIGLSQERQSASPVAVPVPPAPKIGDTAASRTESWLPADYFFAERQARELLPGQSRMLNQLRSPDSNYRRAAYRDVAAEMFRQSESPEKQQVLLELLITCHAAEPDDEAARALVTETLKPIAALNHNSPPTNSPPYGQAFSAARSAGAIIAGTSDTRRPDVATTVGNLLGRALDPQLSAAELETTCTVALADQLYQLLGQQIAVQPARLRELHLAVSSAAAAHLSAAENDRLTTEFLFSVLAEAPARWRDFEPLLQQTIASPNALIVARMLKAFEHTSDADLQAFMAELLLNRADVTLETRAVADVAREVRKALGMSEAATPDERVSRFVAEAEQALAAPRVAGSDDEALLVELLRFAQLATLGCAVSKGPAGDVVFDTLAAKDVAESLKPLDAPAAATESPPPIDATLLRQLDDRLRVIASPRNAASSRITAVEGLATVVDRVADLTPAQANKLATYLLSKKRSAEQTALLVPLAALKPWKQLRLAVADQLDETMEPGPIEDIASALLGHAYKVENSAAWQEPLRVALLQSVLTDVRTSSPVEPTPSSTRYDQAAQTMCDFYKSQAELLGAPLPAEAMTTPSAPLKAIIQQVATQMGKGSLAPEEQRALSNLDAELQAIAYLAANDIQQTALLDRLWLRMLGIAVAQKQSDRRAEAGRLVEDLLAADRRAGNVLVQLRDGQAALVRMWLLHHQAEGATP